MQAQLPLRLEHVVATALCSVVPTESRKSDIDWRLVADDFITAVAGVVALVPREEYDKTVTALRDAKKKLRELGVKE